MVYDEGNEMNSVRGKFSLRGIGNKFERLEFRFKRQLNIALWAGQSVQSGDHAIVRSCNPQVRLRWAKPRISISVVLQKKV